MTTPRTIKQLACTCPVCGECWLVSHTGRGHRRCPACHFSGPAQAFVHRRFGENAEGRALGRATENAKRPSGYAPASSEEALPRHALRDFFKRILG